MHRRSAILAAICLGLSPLAADAQDNNAWQILQNKCAGCHGGDAPKAGLKFGTVADVMKGGASGFPGLVPGNAQASAIVSRITMAPESDKIMPPADKGTLTADEILAVIHWINRGAPEGDAAAAPAPAPAATPAAAGGVDFTTQIFPILQARCIECHGADSQKGKLRLDTPEFIMKGTDFGAVVTAKSSGESTLFERITLPPDHDDIMPPKGDPLTPEEVALIKQWIDEGASFEGWAAPQLAEGEKEEDILAKLAEGLEAAPQDALAAIEAVGGLVMPLSADNPLLRVDFQLSGDAVGDEQLALLAPLGSHITWLNLAGTKVTDAGLAQLAPLAKVTSLHLERTAIGDAGVKHVEALKEIRYLNLYATQVTDAAVESLKALPNLRKLYLWQSQVTSAGADALRAANDKVDINLGTELALLAEPEATEAAAPAAESAPADPAAPAIDLTAFFDAGGCCAAAKAAGKTCDHPCCVAAAEKATVCDKCNPEGAKKLAVSKDVAKFDEGGCCATALLAASVCDHPCCVEAAAANTVCAKCNPKSAAAGDQPA